MKSATLEKLLPTIKAAINNNADAAEQVKLQSMDGDASTRRYFRIKINDRSYIVMYLPEDVHKSDEITKTGIDGELPFLQVASFLAKGGIKVPDILLSRVDERILILEDLGDDTFEKLLKKGVEKSGLYKSAILEMVRMHKWAFENPDPDCVCFNRSFDKNLLTWECEHFMEWGIEALTGIPLSWAETARLNKMFTLIVNHLTSVSQGFVHRDYQSRNLMRHDNKIAVIDFQDALIGPYVYDITALLRDSYVLFDDRETTFYLSYFYKLRRDAGLPMESNEAFLKTFHFQTIQRKLKDAGRFVFIDRKKGNPKFLANIPRSLKYALNSMKRFPEFDDTRRLIEDRLADFITDKQ